MTTKRRHSVVYDLCAALYASEQVVGGFKPLKWLRERDPAPRWPSGIPELDERTGGGFYGMSYVVGYPKLGKSMVVERSTLEAAREGWRVFYFFGEGTDAIVQSRASGVLGPHFSKPEQHPDWLENWDAIHFDPGVDLGGIVQEVVKRAPDYTGRTLLVIDSVNRLAKAQAKGNAAGAYFKALERINRFAQLATERSNGHIGVLLVSEANRHGGGVGMDLEYSAACLLYLQRRANPSLVRLELHSRDTAGGMLGDFVRIPHECRLARASTDVEPHDRQWGDDSDRETDADQDTTDPIPF